MKDQCELLEVCPRLAGRPSNGKCGVTCCRECRALKCVDRCVMSTGKTR